MVDRALKKILQKSESIQMRPKSRKKIRHNPLKVLSFSRWQNSFLCSIEQKRFRRKIQNPDGSGLKPKGSVFFQRNLFCSVELKKEFCYRVKLKTFNGLCRIFYLFFETLVAFECFCFSADPF